MSRYLRFAAIGDSTTFGIGDPVPGGWRGWSRLLAHALATTYDVSFCNVARSGGTSSTALEEQLPEALAHRPDLASFVVGVNDVLRSTWDPERVRQDLMATAGKLTAEGALLLTVRYHDHSRILRLPGFMTAKLQRRLGELNEVWDDVHDVYGGPRVDLGRLDGLGGRGDVMDPAYWCRDRMHPNELGHRMMARACADALAPYGFEFRPTSLEPSGGLAPTWRRDVAWVLAEGAPWMTRRAEDFGPWAVRAALRVPAPVRPAELALPAPR